MREHRFPKKCLVFGANGYIGRHLVNSLVNNGYHISAYDMNEHSAISNVTYHRIDLVDVESLSSIDWDVDLIFMFAGITGTHAGFDEYIKYVNVNEISLLHILDCIRKSDHRPRIIFPSTRLVYKGSDLLLKEDAPKEAKTIYAANKLACENLLEVYKNTFDIPYTVYRICVPYGNSIGSAYSYGTVGNFLKQAISNSVIRLYGDGSLRRTFTHVEDICLQIIMSCNDGNSLNKTFNTIGEDYSLKEVAGLIAHKYKSDLDFVVWPENDLKIESGHTVFNSEVLHNLYNLKLVNNVNSWIDNLK